MHQKAWRTDGRTNNPEAICPSNNFEVGGIKKLSYTDLFKFEDKYGKQLIFRKNIELTGTSSNSCNCALLMVEISWFDQQDEKIIFSHMVLLQYLIRLIRNQGVISACWRTMMYAISCQFSNHFRLHLGSNCFQLHLSVGCAVRLETRKSQVQPPPRSATFFRGDWSWNIFYGHSLPSAESRRAVVSFWRKNVHNTG